MVRAARGCQPVIETWLRHQRRMSTGGTGRSAVDTARDRCRRCSWSVDGRTVIATRSCAMVAARVPANTWAVIGPWGHGWPTGLRPARTSTGSTPRCAGGGGGWTTTATARRDRSRVRVYVQDLGDRRSICSTGRADGSRARREPRGRDDHVQRHDLATGGRRPPSPVIHRRACTRRSGVRKEIPTTSHSISVTKMRSRLHRLGSRRRHALLGRPVAHLGFGSTSRGAGVVRLCDVAPDGVSTLVAMGVGQYGTADKRRPCRCGRPGTSCPQDTRLRLAVAPGYWPMLWPCPPIVTINTNARVSARAATCAEGDTTRSWPQAERPPREDHRADGLSRCSARLRSDASRHRLGRGAPRRRLVVASRRPHVVVDGRRPAASIDDDDRGGDGAEAAASGTCSGRRRAR